MWIEAGSTRGGAAGVRGGVPWPSPCFWIQKSSRACTTGTTAKLYTGGGDGMVHSSVRPSHGSAGAGAPERVVFTTFKRKTSRENTMISEPTVATRFQKFHPRSGA